jgi:hypothetical protein
MAVLLQQAGSHVRKQSGMNHHSTSTVTTSTARAQDNSGTMAATAYLKLLKILYQVELVKNC